jgi:SAM-dependent methyltransferase
MTLDRDDQAITDRITDGISDRMAEDWLVTLDLNAAFDRPWTDEAVAWAAGGADLRVVLDAGCGAGGAACAFADRLGPGALVVAADRDPRLVAQAGRRARAEGVPERVRLCVGSVDALPVRPGSMDLVWASGVVHHVADQQRAVEALARLAVPGRGRVALVEGGLPLRCLPHDVGVGRPGLEARLDGARARWFEDMRAELSGPALPHGWPGVLHRAGLVAVRTRSFLAERVPPLDEVGRRTAAQHLSSALHELGDLLDLDDRRTLERLLDPDDDANALARDDLVVTAVRTVHVGMRPPS